MKVNELLKLDVEDLALGGKALARVDGRVVFVDRGLPGDQVGARVTRVKRSYAEARLESIERSSPMRIEAPCPHFRALQCGGCRFQDLAYEEQLRSKSRQVREALVHLGGIAAPSVRAIVPAPATYGYRNKMEFSFHPGKDHLVLGLHERGTFDKVFELETCLLPSPLTVEIVRLTQRFARQREWRAYDPRHRGLKPERAPAEVRYLTVRHLPTTGECAVHLVASGEGIPELEAWARDVAALSSEVRTVTLLVNRSRANIAFGEQERVLEGAGVIVERLLGLEFQATANAFLQTNSLQAEALYSEAIRGAELTGAETVLDLYCGTGTLTLLMARGAKLAVGVESVPDAVERAHRNASLNELDNARFVEGEARRVLREWARGEREPPWGRGGRPEVVVVDPPRAGLHPRVVTRVAELKPARIVYVSCNPATLARDVKDFAAQGYQLGEVAPYDMFPHTPHIECVARLTPS